MAASRRLQADAVGGAVAGDDDDLEVVRRR